MTRTFQSIQYLYNVSKYYFLVIIIIIIPYACNGVINNNDTVSKADAGIDQETYVGSYVVFDILKSFINEPIDIIEWIQDVNNPQEVSLFASSLIEKSVAGFEKEGIYKFILAIRCKNGNAYTDSMIVIVQPRQVSLIEDVNLEIHIRYRLKYKEGILDYGRLQMLDTLVYYEVSTNYILSLKGIENCKNLTYLCMGSQRISDLSSLSILINLTELYLDQNWMIVDISSLRNLVNLKKLNLQGNLIEDISIIKYLIELRYLNIMENPIQNLSPIGQLQKLEELWLDHAQDGDLKFITNLKELSLLWMTVCNVKDILPLKDLTNLRRINFDWNQISDLSPISNLKQLEWLYLDKNQVEDITSLEFLENLTRLRLWNNQITDILPLVNNKGLQEGDNVGLFGNPLNEKSINEYIHALKARGVNVEW